MTKTHSVPTKPIANYVQEQTDSRAAHQSNQPSASTEARATPYQFPCKLAAAPFFEVVAAGGAVLVVLVAPDGLLDWSSARGLMARPVITAPLLPSTCWLTVVVVTETSFPCCGLEMPLSIRACAPDGRTGMVKFLENSLVVIREALQAGGVTVVFCALIPWREVTFRVLY